MVGNVREWVAGDTVAGLVEGGSYLCGLNDCANFRPAASQAQTQDLPTSHIGFRVAYPVPEHAERVQAGFEALPVPVVSDINSH